MRIGSPDCGAWIERCFFAALLEPVWDFGTMNYQGSSLINQSGVATTLYDDTFFSGDSHTFNMPGASYYWEIWSIGWNDRACSGVCFYL